MEFHILKFVCITLLFTMSVLSAKQPHILFILADDLGYNDIGYHDSEVHTPVLDALARDGVILENYYVYQSCSPSRTALMSGRYGVHSGIQYNIITGTDNGIPLDISIVSDQLKAAGYQNHMVGKWGVGYSRWAYTPTHRGFDSFLGYLNPLETYVTHICKGNLVFCPEAGCYKMSVSGHDLRLNEDSVYTEEYSTTLYMNRTLQVVRDHDPQQSLFMYIAFQSSHIPFSNDDEAPRYMEIYSHVSDITRRRYLASISYMDFAVGEIVNAYKQAGLWENTVLVFSSDNGGSPGGGASNLPLRGQKYTLYEGGIRVAGFVHSNLLSNPGYVNHELIHITDWYPTFMRLAGSDVTQEGLDGFDQWDTISLNAPSPRHDIIHAIDPVLQKRCGSRLYNDSFDNTVYAALRHEEWKILTGCISESATGRNIELYNIEEDPSENHEVSDLYPEKVRELLDLLVEYNATTVPILYPSTDYRSLPQFHDGNWGPWIPDDAEYVDEISEGWMSIIEMGYPAMQEAYDMFK